MPSERVSLLVKRYTIDMVVQVAMTRQVTVFMMVRVFDSVIFSSTSYLGMPAGRMLRVDLEADIPTLESRYYVCTAKSPLSGRVCMPHSPPHLLVPIHLPARSLSSVDIFVQGAQPRERYPCE